ncbi:hypothetical protein, partial [uncultured Planktomarina sp.]|uniref:hypothetical protein n=1 Tax=uncultured Planktomarina sp. TaxID=1538529 RepID=UPI0032613891
KSPAGVSWRNDRSCNPAPVLIASASALLSPVICAIIASQVSFFPGKMGIIIAIIAIFDFPLNGFMAQLKTFKNKNPRHMLNWFCRISDISR